MSANPTDGDWRAEHRRAIANGEITVITQERGHGVTDPRDFTANAPEFDAAGMLPPIFNNFVQDKIAKWGGDRGAYAGNFMAMHCAKFHSSVKMNTNPMEPDNWRHPNDFALTVAKSGQNKSGMFKDLTANQEKWQLAMTRAQAVRSKGSKKGPPMCFLQYASIEGLFHQLADNGGERLLMGSDEAMSFYDGAALHHKENNASSMSNAVCTVYDGGMFNKRLVGTMFAIPSALATLIMTTTIDKIVGWKAFPYMVDSGLMARHTVSVLGHIEPPDPTKIIPGATQALDDMLLKLQAMRDYRFVLADDAAIRWLAFKDRKEAEIARWAEFNEETEGLINWARKYDMRVMTMATILQAYEFWEAGGVGAEEVALPPETHEQVAEARVMRTVRISLGNLSKAVKFVEGYLTNMQRFFYERAKGVTKFGPELINFMAYRFTKDEPDNPSFRVIARKEITHNGPAMVRGGVTEERKALWCEWVQALLDHGFIEVYDHPRQRAVKRPKADNEAPWYKMTDEFFEFFEPHREALAAIYEKSRSVGERRNTPLEL